MRLHLLFIVCAACFVSWAQSAPAQHPAQKPASVPAASKAFAPAKAQPAAEKPSAGPDDLALIRQGSEAFMQAFDKGDAPAVAGLWTADGEYISEAGQVYNGRAAIQEVYEQYFTANPKTKLKIVIDSLKLLSPTAAIEDGRAMVEPAPAGSPGLSKYTAVHVKVNGKWLLSSVRDSRVEIASGYNHVADLEWLIGRWTAEEHGSKNESVCRWVANKSFVERTYTVTRPDGSSSSGVQIIGFNPQSGQVQSWNYSSDGGIAIGVWIPRENGWAAELHGTLGDGTSTHAVNLLTKLDENAYSWQSVQRTVGDSPLEDTDEMVLRRSMP